ncbi:hypothetical protein [Candidatus Solirubrobacter pratensis]|uniref:hypothetical protein n=1 Tax=Candidatus Solirubrobacter pratensis TaxID=1298857 RepID=UPI0012DD1B43|nr:hypothetical protein [Candidatus Solirubrobacter pratensis]
MRVTWVHPSWRDLVIAELARDVELRRRFLKHCGVDGAALALSREGGGDGTRARPLLREDTDWDALGDGLHRLCDELDPREAVRLLAVLEGDDDETRALTSQVLERIERCWNGQAVEVEMLEAWTQAAAGLPKTRTVAATWLELEPACAPATPVELERFADWLRLAELLRAHDDELLDGLGFPKRFKAVLDAFVDQQPEDEPPFERDLRQEARLRLVRLDPSRAVAILDQEPEIVADVRRFEIPELDPLAPSFAVDRVLRDLVD